MIQHSLVRPGDSRLIYFVGYPDISDAASGKAWAIIDARTGEFIAGDAPSRDEILAPSTSQK